MENSSKKDTKLNRATPQLEQTADRIITLPGNEVSRIKARKKNKNDHLLDEISHVLNEVGEVLNEMNRLLKDKPCIPEKEKALNEMGGVLDERKYILNKLGYLLEEIGEALQFKKNNYKRRRGFEGNSSTQVNPESCIP